MVKRGLASILCPTQGDDLSRRYLDMILMMLRTCPGRYRMLSIEHLINFFHKSYYLSNGVDLQRFYQLFPKFDTHQFSHALKDNVRKVSGSTRQNTRVRDDERLHIVRRKIEIVQHDLVGTKIWYPAGNQYHDTRVSQDQKVRVFTR